MPLKYKPGRHKDNYDPDRKTDADDLDFVPPTSGLGPTNVGKALRQILNVFIAGLEARIIVLEKYILLQLDTIKTVYVDYVILDIDSVVLCDCTLGDIQITLLPVVTNSGRGITLTKVDDTNNVVNIIVMGGGLVMGETTMTICFRWTSGTFITDGISYTAR